MGFPECDIGVVLNVTSDHLGLGDIETLEDMARVKSVLVEAVHERGYAVLNADDGLVVILPADHPDHHLLPRQA